MASDEFTGFTPEGLQFLRDLGSADKVRFDEHRQTYADAVVAPTKAFVVALGERLDAEISSTIVYQPKPNGSIAPINNDLRFSPDKSPYKDHLLLRFWDGPTKKTAPTLMVRIGPDQVGFSSAMAIASNDRWRAVVDDDMSGSELTAILQNLGDIDQLDVGGDELKRVPKPYAPDHPRGGLLRLKGGLYVRWPEPTPALIHTPEFVDHCIQRLGRLAELHHWFLASGL